MRLTPKSHRLDIFLLFIISLTLIFISDDASAKTSRHRHHKARAGVSRTAAYADIVIEASTGRILHSVDADSPRHPASLTKMMTLYLTFQALESGRIKLDQQFSVSANAAEQSPSKLGLRRGQRITVENAILGVVTESANDAAMVLAEGIGGSEERFGQLMTQQARTLGMTRSNFRNPNGLPDPVQVTSARDMAILGHALLNHYSQYYPYFSTANFTYAGIRHANHNHLMERYQGMDGIKTGYIRASGFNLVASVEQNDVRLIGVIFGGRSATSRDNQMAQLLDQAFEKLRRERGERVASADDDDSQGDSSSRDERERYVSFSGKTTAATARVPAVEQPQPAAVATAPGSWGIQIGAFADEQTGKQALASVVRAMPQLLNHADPIVQEVSAGGVTLYRARLQGTDEKTARAVCGYLVRHGQNCLAVAPEVTIAN